MCTTTRLLAPTGDLGTDDDVRNYVVLTSEAVVTAGGTTTTTYTYSAVDIHIDDVDTDGDTDTGD